MRTVTVNGNDAGQRLDKFLGKFFKSMPAGMLYKAIRKKRVKVNGRRADISYRLSEGDKIDLYINDEFFEDKGGVKYEGKPSEIKIVYEDDNILVADKPSGLPCHSGGKGCEDTLISRITAYLFKNGEFDPSSENTFAPALCNRLDRNTSGLVIAAKNAATLRVMNEKIRRREVEKYYVCTVIGVPEEKSGVIETYLKKDGKTNAVSVSQGTEGARRAVTEYKVIGKTESGARVEARLITGRTHQIRVHMAHIGHPIEGDVKYGAPKNGRRDFQNLRAYKIKFNFKENCALDYLNQKTIEA